MRALIVVLAILLVALGALIIRDARAPLRRVSPPASTPEDLRDTPPLNLEPTLPPLSPGNGESAKRREAAPDPMLSTRSAPLPRHLAAGADEPLELRPGDREFLEWGLGLYAALQECAGPRIHTTRALTYWLTVDVDDVGHGTVTFEERRDEEWMYQEWTAAELSEHGQAFADLWGGAPVEQEELDAVRDCATAYVTEHGRFQAHPTWWGAKWQRAMSTRFPVTRAAMYEYAVQ